MSKLSYSNVNNIDVLVVGAGPIGLAASLWFVKKNYNVILIEQYGETKIQNKKAFNERHQQIGLNPESLNFIKNLDVIVWGEIKTKGCSDVDWINIPVYILQNILIKEIRNHDNINILFDTTILSVCCVNTNNNCRVLLSSGDIYYAVAPKIVIIADGKHDDKGAAKQFFGFSSASKVKLSTYGIVGMIERQEDDAKGSVCLKNYTHDCYISDLFPDIGAMYIRLLGNLKERYIALGLNDNNNLENFKSLNSDQIRKLLTEAYNQKRDKIMGEPEITDNDFSDYSKNPIPIVLDYRKETIKLLEGSSTIVTIEGDAARKTTFFSGSGLNSGYKALQKFFNFCQKNESYIFCNCNDNNYLLSIDQKLLKKDQECMHISLELLIKGINYIGNKNHHTNLKDEDKFLLLNDPVIYSISPEEGEVPWFIYINGENLITEGNVPTCIFEWDNDSSVTNNIIVYSNKMIGVKIPRNAENTVTIILKRKDEKIAISPIRFNVIRVLDVPQIINIHKEDEWLCIEGKNFKKPAYVTVKYSKISENESPKENQSYESTEQKIKAYCNSVSFLTFIPPVDLQGKVSFIVHSPNGSSNEFIKNIDDIL